MRNDENYVLDLCDKILGETSERQHKFPFLTGDNGHMLPVDAYFPRLNLVIEYREQQHSELVHFFNRRMTISNVSRGEQRAIYDERRRKVLPQNGIRLIEIDFTHFAYDSKKRIRRHYGNDKEVLSTLLSGFVVSR